MFVFAALSLAFSSLLGSVLGVRLILLFLRTRMLPELAIGFASLGVGLAGPLLQVLTGRPDLASSPALQALWALALLLLGVSSAAVALINCRVFHPGDARAAALCGLFLAALVGWWGISIATGTSLRGTGPVSKALFYLGRYPVQAWAVYECFTYAAKLRRRAALGLADPFMAHRFALWGFSSATLLGLYCVTAFVEEVLGLTAMKVPLALFACSFLGISSSIGIWLAFFPPAFYRRLPRFAAPELR